MLHSASQSIHMGAYVQSSDPGAVGAKVLWIDTTSGYVLKKRNDADDGWDTLGTLTSVALSDGDKGDITVSGSGATWEIDAGVVGSTELADEAVTYAKMQHVSATDKVLGRSTAGSGDVEEIACTSAGRALLDDADAAAQRTTLGLTGTNAQTASYTLVLGDAFKLVTMNVASANNLTVPPNSSVAFPTGTRIEVIQLGAGQTTIVEDTGVTVRTPETLKLSGQYAGAMLVKIGTDEWVLVGNLEAAP